MDVFEKEILGAHCEQQNLGSFKQGAELLLHAVGENDTKAVITAADWVTEVAQRIKLSTRIKCRISHIERAKSGTDHKKHAPHLDTTSNAYGVKPNTK